MTKLPSEILSLYRMAAPKEILSWSYGMLRIPRKRDARTWEDRLETLDCQRIFGPLHDFVCACGKFCGVDRQGMMCDICGVKIGPSELRRSRFAHVELTVDVSHPLSTSDDSLRFFPILPAGFHQSPAGGQLAESYDDLVRANSSEEHDAMEESVCRIFDILVPVVINAHNWNLADAELLAQGLALVRKTAAVENSANR